MNKIFSALLLASLVTIGFVSCDKETVIIDQEPNAPAFSKFNTLQPADTIGRYFVRSTGNPFKIPVGITNVSSADRTIQLTYTSRSAVQGAQYNAPATIVIPAGKAVDSLTIQGLFAGYPTTTRVDTVRIEITGGDVPVSGYKNRYQVIMRKYCDVVLANVGGAYTRTFEGTYGPYTSTVSNVTSTGATTATATISNIYDSNITANVTFDWTDPASFKVTMAAQQTQYTSGGLPLFIRTNPNSASSFSSCDNTITLNLQLYTTAGIYDQWTSSMAK